MKEWQMLNRKIEAVLAQAATQRRKAKPAKMPVATTLKPYSWPKLSTMFRAASLELELLVAVAPLLPLPVVVAAAPPKPVKTAEPPTVEAALPAELVFDCVVMVDVFTLVGFCAPQGCS